MADTITKETHDKLVRTFDTKLKAAEGERAVVARISTIDVDRDGDVMLPSGIDTSDFKKNPVVLFAHNDREIPVGTASDITNGTRFVQAKMTFNKRPESLHETQEWLPDTLFELFQQRALRAFSIGFIPTEMREPTEKDFGRFGDNVRNIITKWQLLEFSIVPVPANQNALVQAVSKGIGVESMRKYWGDDIDIPIAKPVLKIERATLRL